jgi:hypothetical protein
MKYGYYVDITRYLLMDINCNWSADSVNAIS